MELEQETITKPIYEKKLFHDVDKKFIQKKQDQDIDLIIAHWGQFSPRQSGLMETVRDLIHAENRIPGVLAGLVVYNMPKGGISDGDIDLQAHDWAFRDANVHMVHYRETSSAAQLKPRVFMVHGTPETCLKSELSDDGWKGASFTSSLERVQKDDATICLSKRHYYMWKPFDNNNRLHYAPKGVDLNEYSPMGARMDLNGTPAITYGEVWRVMLKDPLMTFYGISEYAKRNPEVKFHPFGIGNWFRIWNVLVSSCDFQFLLGKNHIASIQQYPCNWYRGSHILISPVMTGEPSRVQKEAMACGCPVIAWDTDNFEDSHATLKAKPFDPFDMADKIEQLWGAILDDHPRVRQLARQTAEQYYNIEATAKVVVDVCRQVVNGDYD